jgi:uncharacterized protein YeeX (DUF496 family)
MIIKNQFQQLIEMVMMVQREKKEREVDQVAKKVFLFQKRYPYYNH